MTLMHYTHETGCAELARSSLSSACRGQVSPNPTSHGAWSGSSKLFEALYVIGWYIGPIHADPTLDFIGVKDASASPLFYLALAAALLAAAFFRRSLGLRHGKLAFAP